jgi:hypothetical protein
MGPLNHLEDYYLYLTVIICYQCLLWRDGKLGAYFCFPILQGHVEQVQNFEGVEGRWCSLWVFSSCPKLVFNLQVVATCFLK